MHNPTLRSRAGFTLIELLTVIAIIGILASILFPAIGAAKKAAQKSNDLSNIRSIGQAALMYANDNNDRLPDPIANEAAPTTRKITGTDRYHIWFGLLAQAGNLSDPALLVSKLDTQYPATMPTAILNPDNKLALDGAYTTLIPAYEVVGGVKGADASTTPIAYTRGLKTDGNWDTTPGVGVYGNDGGGLIVFIGGNVAKYKAIGAPDYLINTLGKTTVNILQAVPTGGNYKLYGSGGSIGSTSGSNPIAAQ